MEYKMIERVYSAKGRVFLCLFLLLFGAPSLRAQFYSVQTNGLKLLTTSLNVEGSMMLSRHWTANLALEYNPWTFKDNWKKKNLTIEPGARYWFDQTYIGAYVSLNGMASRYNFTKGGRRYDGAGGGLGSTYGFSWLLGVKWNLEVEGGAGFLWGRHMKYNQCNCGDRYGKESKVFLTPKMAVNLVYLF